MNIRGITRRRKIKSNLAFQASYQYEWYKLDDTYDYLFIGFFSAWAILYFPAAFYEQWRKNYKYIANGGLGNLREHYKASPDKLKTLNMGMQVSGTAFVGWDFGIAANPPTTVSNPITLSCLQEAWSLNYQQWLAATGGAIIAFGLAGPQMASFFGRKKPFYGSIGTAFSYMIFKMASTFYPIFKKQMEVQWNNPTQ
jgi:hypothetical protein